MNMSDLYKQKIAESRKLDTEFLKKFNTKKIEFQYTIDPNINLGRFLLPLCGSYLNRWCTYSKSKQCSEHTLSNFLHPQFRKIFKDVWGSLQIFKDDNRELNINCAGLIANDLKIIYKILKEEKK